MRLFHRIYLSLLAVAFVGIGLTVLVNHDLLKPQLLASFGERLEAEARFLDARTTDAVRRGASVEPALRGAADVLGLMATLVDAEGRRLAATAHDLRIEHALVTDPRWVHTRSGLARVVPLSGGRRLVVRPSRETRDASYAVAGLVLFAVLAALCYPVARRLASRLERLERGVRAWGAGGTGTRVVLAGRDEVARVACSFNEAADRVEGLLAAQKRMLASASHELRSPLARLRMGLELIRDKAGETVAAPVDAAAREIHELDGLVEDVLLASRLDAAIAERTERVDLVALLHAEAERVDAAVLAPAELTIEAEPRALRRLLRNLLENARRHGGNAISAGVEALSAGSRVRVWVADRGPGIPGALAERVFEPFYRLPGHDGGGAGLGLALVRQIAEHHGGRASCRPREDGGTVFEVIWPASDVTVGVVGAAKGE